ncbi:hypothetical protein BJX76DRAFT_345832 [Aspergillus varians]
MASVIQQSHEIPLPEPAWEWKLVSGTRLVRALRGAELVVKSSEHFCDGNAELETALTCEQLKRRHHAAWWRTRRILPVVGVSFPSLDQGSFDLHATPEDAKQWAAQSCLVATNTTVSDVYLARSRQPSQALTMTLVVDPIRGARGCVLNMSHTLIHNDILRVVEEFIFQLARPDTERGIDAVFVPETVANTITRLPQSLSNAYSLHHHQPAQQDLQHAFAIHQRAQDRWTRSSIGIPLHPNHTNRPSRIHNKTIAFEPTEARAAFTFLKQTGTTLTASFFACMTSAIAHAFPSSPDDNNAPAGAHLLFSANGHRYLPPSARNGQGPIAMPILPGGMWLDARDTNLHPTTQPGLLRLARAIEKAQNQDLTSPHIIAVFDQLAPSMASAIAAAHTSREGPPPPPPIGRPTLTSQGRLDLDKARHGSSPSSSSLNPPSEADADAATAGSAAIRITDFNSGGRTTDPTVCFALNSFRDELRFNLLFDERFFDQHDVVSLGFMVARLFRRLIGVGVAAEGGRLAKL